MKRKIKICKKHIENLINKNLNIKEKIILKEGAIVFEKRAGNDIPILYILLLYFNKNGISLKEALVKKVLTDFFGVPIKFTSLYKSWLGGNRMYFETMIDMKFNASMRRSYFFGILKIEKEPHVINFVNIEKDLRKSMRMTKKQKNKRMINSKKSFAELRRRINT